MEFASAVNSGACLLTFRHHSRPIYLLSLFPSELSAFLLESSLPPAWVVEYNKKCVGLDCTRGKMATHLGSWINFSMTIK